MGTFKSWTPLWSGLVDSSIWDEDDEVFRVFMAMLSLKDQDHVVRLSPYQLSRRIRRSEQDVLKALVVLSSPDTKRMEPQEFEGRRIEQTEEGWKILNGEKYRYLVQLEMRRSRNRRSQKAWRDRQKLKNSPQAGERAAVKGVEDGSLDEGTFEPRPDITDPKEEAKAYHDVHTREPIESVTSEPPPAPSTFKKVVLEPKSSFKPSTTPPPGTFPQI
jgi:hypothetical protein